MDKKYWGRLKNSVGRPNAGRPWLKKVKIKKVSAEKGIFESSRSAILFPGDGTLVCFATGVLQRISHCTRAVCTVRYYFRCVQELGFVTVASVTVTLPHWASPSRKSWPMGQRAIVPSVTNNVKMVSFLIRYSNVMRAADEQCIEILLLGVLKYPLNLVTLEYRNCTGHYHILR